jgi:hypothetical protein
VRTYRATNGKELDLTVSKVTLQSVLVVGDDAILDIVDGVGRDLDVSLVGDTHLESVQLTFSVDNMVISLESLL